MYSYARERSAPQHRSESVTNSVEIVRVRMVEVLMLLARIFVRTAMWCGLSMLSSRADNVLDG